MSSPNNLRPLGSACVKPLHGGSVLQSAYSSLLRPTTAVVMKMLNKLIVATPSPSGADKKFTASDIQRLIDKYSRKQRKLRNAHQALLMAIQEWLGELPNDATTAMVGEFVRLMDGVAFVNASHAERLNGLKVHLGSVATREARQLALLRRHDELQRRHDAAAVKHGPQSKQAALVVDEIEENEYNLKLIEQQLARSADSGLREVSFEYLAWFQSALFMLGKRSNALANTLREGDTAHSGMLRSLEPDSARCFSAGVGESAKLSTATLRDPDPAMHMTFGGKIPDDASVLKFDAKPYEKTRHGSAESRRPSYGDPMKQPRWESERDLFKGLEGW